MDSVPVAALSWLALLIGPLAGFALIIHQLEKLVQRHLVERFGWSSVLWTGWLGTPVHELSHVAMCLLFRHRVDKVALFEPDPKSARLGFVQHSWHRGNWFEELGNVFIGIAPLIGGSIALLSLLWLFFPEAVTGDQFPVVEQSTQSSRSLRDIATSMGKVFTPANIGRAKFWIFIYLTICIGSHMAPSWSDYRASTTGLLLCGVLLILLAFGLAMFGSEDLLGNLFELLSPLLVMLLIAVLLVAAGAAIAILFTSPFPKRYRLR